jgi:hypothetical protein
MQLDWEYYSCLQRSGAAASLTLAELTLALSPCWLLQAPVCYYYYKIRFPYRPTPSANFCIYRKATDLTSASRWPLLGSITSTTVCVMFKNPQNRSPSKVPCFIKKLNHQRPPGLKLVAWHSRNFVYSRISLPRRAWP